MPFIEISDILGSGKAWEKLFDVISKGMGRVTKSYFQRKDSETKAKEIKMLAEAQVYAIKSISDAVKENQIGTGNIIVESEGVKIKSMDKLPDFGIFEKTITSQILVKEARRLFNIQSITNNAAEELLNDDDISDESVNDDWINRFFRYAEDISDKQMQILWGRILANEIKKPESFSLRTLQVVRNLSSSEANDIKYIADFVFNLKDSVSFFFILRDEDGFLNDLINSEYNEIIESLIEAGFISTDTSGYFEILINQGTYSDPYIFGNIAVFISGVPNDEDYHLRIPTYYPTKAGIEILKLIERNADIIYVEKFAEYLYKKGLVPMYQYFTIENGKIRYTSKLKKFKFPLDK